MIKVKFLLLSIFLFLIITPSIVFAQSPICNTSEIRREALSEVFVDKNGIVQDNKTFSYANRGADCLLQIRYGFDTKSEINIINANFYDSDGRILLPIKIDDFLLINYDREFKSGETYKFFFDSRLEQSIKYTDGIFCLINNLQVSDTDRATVLITVEKQEPWFEIKFSKISPAPTDKYDSNIMIWELEKPDPTRTIKKIEINYKYDFNWNNIFFNIFIGVAASIILGLIYSNLKNLVRKRILKKLLNIRK